jgi:hypothetical protein
MKPEDKNGKVAKATTQNKEYKIVTQDQFLDPYWDEGIKFYPQYHMGFGQKKKRRLMMFQVRMFRTWKHNRKTQWK